MADEREAAIKVYRAGDAPQGGLADEAVAVLGYGNLGRTAALNLRDSGVAVRIGNRDDEYADRARADGFEVVSPALASSADIVFVLLPDEVIPTIFAGDVIPSLRASPPWRLRRDTASPSAWCTLRPASTSSCWLRA